MEVSNLSQRWLEWSVVRAIFTNLYMCMCVCMCVCVCAYIYIFFISINNSNHLNHRLVLQGFRGG